jgi:hypothetical protein
MDENEEIQDEIVNDDEQYSEESNQSLEAIQSYFEEDEEVQAEEETAIQQKEESAEKMLVVDDALIQQFPTLSGLKGKPIIEIAKSYDSLTREYTKLKQTKVKVEEEKEQDDEDLDEAMPDPYDDPKGFEKWIKGETEKSKKIALDEFNQQMLDKEQLKLQEQEIGAKAVQYQNEIKLELSKHIPNNITPEEAIDFFVKENKDTLLDPNGKLKESTTKFFIENRDLFINMVAKTVINAVKSNNYEHDVKNRAFEIAKKGLQRKTTGVLGHTEAQRISADLSDNDILVQQLYELNQNND